MASQVFQISCFLLLGFCVLLGSQGGASAAARKEYIVYMGNRPKDESSAPSLHKRMIEQVVGSDASKCMGHSYKRSFNGFSAKLTEEEMKKIAKMDGVVSVFPSQTKMLHTTRSWDFMGFSQQVKRSPLESDVIIGVLDTGIWPESESFSDEGFGPPPSKWKGSCQSSSNFTCNNKIIGAKYYRREGEFGPRDLQSPRDSEGHGTHTSSTAAGNVVSKASLMGLGLGTARGGVPSARIAVYKVCWPDDGCPDADILAAFDDAIADGVDIISISIGGSPASDYFIDPIAIGAFHAMKRGILTSSSAGNEGPSFLTVGNVAPWFLSVAASTIDRKFFTLVKLGNEEVYPGVSVNAFEQVSSPLIYAGDAPNTQAGFNRSVSRFCEKNSLDRTLVKGKIVLCDGTSTGQPELLAGATGSVNQFRFKDVAFPVPLPQTTVNFQEGSNIFRYIVLSSNPTATIMKSIERKDSLAPYVAYLSSRGPNPISPNILKPDIAAPGISILAAWTPIGPVASVPEDKRAVPYNIISGTSMACPHVTAVAAYIKSYHPTWSPAAIQSALMTTALHMNSMINRDGELAYGSGHLNPNKAITPGLVYDAGEVDYVKFLCSEGYNAKELNLVTGDNSSCSQFSQGTVWDLNYPSFAFSTPPLKPISHTFYRTLTNVGSPTSIYKPTVIGPSAFRIEVLPNLLSFKNLGQKLSFSVKIEGLLTQPNTLMSASLVWDDGVYQVRSPIVAYTVFQNS